MVKKVKKVLKNNRGFSLIELIVVIAIIGVLAGIAAPNIINYVNTSRKKVDIANATIIANAAAAVVAADNDLASSDKFVIFPDNEDDDGLGEAIKNTLQKVPSPKYESSKKFAVKVTSGGIITVGLADASGNDIATELYPEPHSDYED
ncbi:MAG: ral secretion pathway protein [Petroclostridium sp.]|nr:ral secretion pathway protein [Petroclostridium sp.]